MHSLNPYLKAFFKSTLPAQCNPVNNHVSIPPTRTRNPGALAGRNGTKQALMLLQIFLVPTTECLFTGKDRETNSSFADLAVSEDFLASHVLRISGPTSPGSNNVRDNRGKAKQFNTVNGRSVVVKESFVYSNKGTTGSLALAWVDFPTLTLFQALGTSLKRSYSATSYTILTTLTRNNGSYITSQDLL